MVGYVKFCQSNGDVMRCVTIEEARQTLEMFLGEDSKPRRGDPDMRCGRFYFGDVCIANTFWVALRLIEALGPWEDAWLWLDKPDTSKRYGLHMYQHIRQSYGDLRLLEEAPVHRFRGYEHADLCTFLAVALLTEWSFYLLTAEDYGRVFVSQSSGTEIWVRDGSQLDSLEHSLKSHGIEMGRSTFQPKLSE